MTVKRVKYSSPGRVCASCGEPITDHDGKGDGRTCPVERFEEGRTRGWRPRRLAALRHRQAHERDMKKRVRRS